jgi:hypothetical protein
MSYTYPTLPTNWATMTKKEKEKFAQTSITLEMVETAQEFVPDLFGKFSKTKTGSVLKKLRKEISVSSYVWNSYMSPSETPIPVLLQVFNSVINDHDDNDANMQLAHDTYDDNEAEIATLKAEVARVAAERDGLMAACEEHLRESREFISSCEEEVSRLRAMEPDGPPPPLELVMCMPDGTELPQCWWESSFAAVFSDGFWAQITEPMGECHTECYICGEDVKPNTGLVYNDNGDQICTKCQQIPNDEVVEETVEEILDSMYSWTKNYTVAAFKKRHKKDKIDPITLWQSICEEVNGAQKRSNAIKKEKIHPIIKKLEIKVKNNGDETMLRSISTQKKNYESRVKKIPKNFKDAIQQCQ